MIAQQYRVEVSIPDAVWEKFKDTPEYGVRDMRNVSYTVFYDGRKIGRMIEKAARNPNGVSRCAGGALIVKAVITGGGS